MQTTPFSIPESQTPQLDGDQDFPDCKYCQKCFEDKGDYKWHYETEIGQEDCWILRSMLPNS